MRLDLIRVGRVRFWRLRLDGFTITKVFWADVPEWDKNFKVYLMGGPWLWMRENDGEFILEILRKEMEVES